MINQMNTAKKIISFTAGFALTAAPFAFAEGPGGPPSIPEDFADHISEYREAQDQLVQERRDFAESLRDLSTEERLAAIEEFREENADRVAAHREFGELIRADMRNLEVERPDRPGFGAQSEQPDVDRPDIGADLQEMMDDFREQREALLQERRDVLQELRDATQEEREDALADLRAEQKETIEAQKELARSIRDQVTDIREDRRNQD